MVEQLLANLLTWPTRSKGSTQVGYGKSKEVDGVFDGGLVLLLFWKHLDNFLAGLTKEVPHGGLHGALEHTYAQSSCWMEKA